MQLDRRQLLRYGFGSLVLGACSRASSSAPRDAIAAYEPLAPAPLAPTPQVDDGDGSPQAPPTDTCAPTADNIEGPFYKPGAPSRAVLVGDRDPGERLVLSGRVRSTACAAIAGATLDIWHADHRGGYDNDGFGLRGQIVTDREGRWQLSSIVPGRYLNGRRYRPSHIHVKVRAPDRDELTTQLYFEGDPYLRGDPWVVASLVLAHRRRGDRRIASFDFVIA